MTRTVDESICSSDEEKVRSADVFGERELSLGFLKIEIDVESADEVGYRVCVLVGFLLDDADDVFELLLMLARVTRAVSASDDSSCQVPQNPRATGLDGVDVCGAKEKVEELVAGLVVVEERE